LGSLLQEKTKATASRIKKTNRKDLISFGIIMISKDKKKEMRIIREVIDLLWLTGGRRMREKVQK
jgi:uncharacterized protein YlxP (DUF503 family)